MADPTCTMRSGERYLQQPPKEIIRNGNDLLETISEAAKKEGLVSWLLGSDCWSTSLRSIEKDCRSMSERDKTRLSIYMLNCLLRQTKIKTVKCTKAMEPSECLHGMDQSKFASFTVILTNIHTICLSIQNREFILDVEKMTSEMHLAARSAAIHLQKLESDINQISNQATSLHDSLFSSIQSTARESEARQQQIMNHWKSIEDRAIALEARQGRYEDALMRMLSSTTELALTSEKIHSTINQVVKYEERAEEAIQMILGRRALFSDALFYLLMLACALLLGAIPRLQKAAPPLLLTIMVTLIIERSISSSSILHTLLGISIDQGIHFLRIVCVAILVLILFSSLYYKGAARSLDLEVIRKLEHDLRESIHFYRQHRVAVAGSVQANLAFLSPNANLNPEMPASLLEIDDGPISAAVQGGVKRRRIDNEDIAEVKS